ncbi:MAG TPA: hypothetical protein VFY06_13045 [Verrucomicrobiae bacterium]|nr:hypothetical protein [Verrucomicrobiae bacterium]
MKILILAASLALLCSCSTAPNWAAKDAVRPPLPAEISFNKDAGIEEHLFVKLHLKNGPELLFVVDSGTPITVLDNSLEPLLGKRLGETKLNYEWGGKVPAGLYDAPQLYSGDTQLLTGDWILTHDLKQFDSNQPIMGILGTDCLRHYCLQLDFAAGNIRFLDPDHLNDRNLGEAFPLTLDPKNPLTSTRASFFGQRDGYFIVDTGETRDAGLKSKYFQQVLQEQAPDFLTQFKTSSGLVQAGACFSTVKFDGQTYRNFVLGDSPDANVIGLRFMSRFLVTLDYPKRTMYLQRRNDDPFPNGGASITNSPFYAATMEVERLFSLLKRNGQLPGISKDAVGVASLWMPGMENMDAQIAYPFSPTISVTQTGDASRYHYTFVKASKDAPWKLRKAWRTDAKNRTVEEYPIP